MNTNQIPASFYAENSVVMCIWCGNGCPEENCIGQKDGSGERNRCVARAEYFLYNPFKMKEEKSRETRYFRMDNS